MKVKESVKKKVTEKKLRTKYWLRTHSEEVKVCASAAGIATMAVVAAIIVRKKPKVNPEDYGIHVTDKPYFWDEMMAINERSRGCYITGEKFYSGDYKLDYLGSFGAMALDDALKSGSHVTENTKLAGVLVFVKDDE